MLPAACPRPLRACVVLYQRQHPSKAPIKVMVPAVMSVMRGISVPYGISTPSPPPSRRHITVCDQKNRIYYFEPYAGDGGFLGRPFEIDFGQGTLGAVS